jgi:Lipoate-protein ligase A
MQRWRFLDEEWEDPYFNMAVEEAVARSVGEGKAPNTIRFWRNPCAVVLGKFQQVSGEVNLRACQKWEVCVIRRFTGGGAVYHDPGNLNYSVSIHENSPDPLSMHRMSGNGVIEALESFGVKQNLGEIPPGSVIEKYREWLVCWATESASITAHCWSIPTCTV